MNASETCAAVASSRSYASFSCQSLSAPLVASDSTNSSRLRLGAKFTLTKRQRTKEEDQRKYEAGSAQPVARSCASRCCQFFISKDVAGA